MRGGLSKSATFALLGRFDVRAGDDTATLPGRHATNLLAVLLLDPDEPVDDDSLMDLAWDGTRTTIGALRITVSRLRRWLEITLGRTNILERTARGYRLRIPAEDVDSQQFQHHQRSALAVRDPRLRVHRLGTALHLWRGPALADLPDGIRSQPQVQALERSRVQTAMLLADAALTCGAAPGVLPEMLRVAALHSYHEPLHARLIAVLAASGQQADALRHFHRLRRGLAEDLGVDPSTDLQQAYLAVLRAEPAALLDPYRTSAAPAVERGYWSVRQRPHIFGR